jgi:ubiquinone/menaquinone biosynthesis C-methylase UbiE
MHHRNKNQYWHDEAGKFSSLYSEKSPFSFKKIVTRFLNARTEQLKRLVNITANQSLLDIGCGNGVHVQLFSPCCSKLVGLDYSGQMIDEARLTMVNRPDKNWMFTIGDAQNLPYNSGSYHWIISMGLLDYVDSIETCFSEMSRVIKRPGTMVFSIPKTPSAFGFLRSSFGNILRKKLFDLPPIRNAISRKRLVDLCVKYDFKIIAMSSVWSTMWLVKIRAE